MSFSGEWLDLREGADSAARSGALVDVVVAALPDAAPLRVLDLGTGTGANVRYLMERLPVAQDWVLVDRDAVLLAEISGRMRAWATPRGYDLGQTVAEDDGGLVLRRDSSMSRLRFRHLDLLTAEIPTIVAGCHLVTASALLDLVSEQWLRALVAQCRVSRAAMLFALSYDGRAACVPREAEDEEIRRLVNLHQRTDKGLGAALGPVAAEHAIGCLADAGYEVRRESSDWDLPPESRDLQQALITGWAEAAAVIAPGQAASIHAWRTRRLAHVAAHRSRITVGHVDLAAWPNW